MKLYFAPHTCSLSPHILLQETGTPYELQRVDLKSHRTDSGDDYYTINARGQVPLLVLSTGEQLTEGPIISQYIVEQAGATDLLPAAGLARYRVLEWQNYITTELHKSFSPLFNSAFSAEAKDTFRSLLRKKYEWVNTHLADQPFLLGEKFTMADPYLFVVTNWAKVVGLDIADLTPLQKFLANIAERPSVQAALKAEAAQTATTA